MYIVKLLEELLNCELRFVSSLPVFLVVCFVHVLSISKPKGFALSKGRALKFGILLVCVFIFIVTLGFGYAGKTCCVMGVRMITPLIIWPAFEKKKNHKNCKCGIHKSERKHTDDLCSNYMQKTESVYYPQIKL